MGVLNVFHFKRKSHKEQGMHTDQKLFACYAASRYLTPTDIPFVSMIFSWITFSVRS